MPINGAREFLPLGELAGEPSVLILALFAAAAAISSNGRFRIPSGAPTILLVLFCAWLVVGGVLNLPRMAGSSYKDSWGPAKFAMQMAMLGFFLLVFLLLYDRLRRLPERDVFLSLRAAFVASFALCAAYSLLEVPRLFGADVFGPIREVIDRLYRSEDYVDYGMRLRSLTFEAPSLGMYLAFAFPWLLSFLITGQRFLGLLLSSLALAMILLSESRTGLVVTLLTTMLFVGLAALQLRGQSRLLIVGGAIAVVGAYVIADGVMGFPLLGFIMEKLGSIVSVEEESSHYVSNLGRWGAQYASVVLFLDHPWQGVGFGQQGFWLPQYYPDWSLGAFNIKDWSDPDSPKWPPAFSMYTRLLAETGVLGAVLFVTFLFTVARRALVALRSGASGRDPMGIVVLLNIFVSLLALFQFGSFRVFYVWLSLALALSYYQTRLPQIRREKRAL